MDMLMGFSIAHAIAGLIGGLIRGIVGVTSDKTFNPDQFKFRWKYFAITLFVSAVVGTMSGVIANNDWRIALLAGYAGTDFLEGLYKLRFAQFFKIPV